MYTKLNLTLGVYFFFLITTYVSYFDCYSECFVYHSYLLGVVCVMSNGVSNVKDLD